MDVVSSIGALIVVIMFFMTIVWVEFGRITVFKCLGITYLILSVIYFTGTIIGCIIASCIEGKLLSIW